MSISDLTIHHEKKIEKMCKYYRTIKDADPARYEKIKENEQMNFMKSLASSVDHERETEKSDWIVRIGNH